MNEQELLLGKLYNKQVVLTENHPHAGCAGKIVRMEETPTGAGLVIELNEEHLGVKEVFVFKPTEIEHTVKINEPTRKNEKT